MRDRQKKDKKRIFEYVECIIKPFEKELNVRLFAIKDIQNAIFWAKKGHIAIHENYASKRKKIFHIISNDEKKIIKFCNKIGISKEKIIKKELYKFSHVNWAPFYEPFENDKN